jgi:hypothetical protein
LNDLGGGFLTCHMPTKFFKFKRMKIVATILDFLPGPAYVLMNSCLRLTLDALTPAIRTMVNPRDFRGRWTADAIVNECE